MKTNLAAVPFGGGARVMQRVVVRPREQAAPKEMDLVVQLAHDIRSPLSGILMLAELLRDGGRDPVTESQRRQLDLIYGAALSLCVSASDVVQLAINGQGLDDERAETFSVSDVLRAVSDMASPLAAGKNLELSISAPSIDRRRGCARTLTRVLLNLTTNALKYTEQGKVEIAAREIPGSRDRLEFFVRDSGPGIGDSVLRAMDEPACENIGTYRGSLTSAGLGLSICKKLLGRMHSALHFETSASSGTRFFFEVAVPCA